MQALRRNLVIWDRHTITLTLVIAAVSLFSVASVFTGQNPQERPLWDVRMARNTQASSTLTLRNECKQPHTFTVSEEATPFLKLLAAATTTVPGSSTHAMPVRFDTNGMNVGQYQGTVLVKCDDCRKEKTCKQDREVLPLRITITDDGPSEVPRAGERPGPIAGPTPKKTDSPAKDPVEGRGYDDNEEYVEVTDEKSIEFGPGIVGKRQETKCKSGVSDIGGVRYFYCVQERCGPKGVTANCLILRAKVNKGEVGKWEVPGNQGKGMVEKKDKDKIKEKGIPLKGEKGWLFGCFCMG